ncbi:MAG: hypothetical protein E7018_04140 [Alphaproteobacteria bacterium]|nr:hypothetical protein [Alphaproteobacteria bacterium]
MRFFNVFTFLMLGLVVALDVWAQDFGDGQVEIGLQNLQDRTVVRCYGDTLDGANECAEKFEQEGYVRFRDIPYNTAKYDFLKVDTYPTRRWRDTESAPRW